jgi:hypothetical protein
MSKKIALAAMAAITALPLLATSASATTWEFLGVRKVNGLVDHDTIHVGIGEGVFKKIRVKVRGNGLWLYDLDVRYFNGGRQDIPVRLHIPQGGQTRAIDLNGYNRFIRNVQFTYGKLPNGNGPTYIELWGKH